MGPNCGSEVTEASLSQGPMAFPQKQMAQWDLSHCAVALSSGVAGSFRHRAAHSCQPSCGPGSGTSARWWGGGAGGGARRKGLWQVSRRVKGQGTAGEPALRSGHVCPTPGQGRPACGSLGAEWKGQAQEDLRVLERAAPWGGEGEKRETGRGRGDGRTRGHRKCPRAKRAAIRLLRVPARSPLYASVSWSPLLWTPAPGEQGHPEAPMLP